MFHGKHRGRRRASTAPDQDDNPIAHAAATAVRVLSGQAGSLPRPPTTRILTVANQKGGVGKTTTTVNLAAALALHGLRTLVVDLDPQGNASTALGVPHHAGTASVYEVLVDGAPLADVVQPVDGFPSLFGVPATIDLAGAEIELVSLVARETRLQRALAAYLSNEHAAGRAFDYVFVDCPPSLGLLTVNALVAAREVLIPIQAEYYALEGLGQLLRSIELVRAHLNPDLAVSTILVTMYDARTRLAAQVADEVRSHFGDARAADGDPALGPGLGGAELWPDRDDLRSGLHGCLVLSRGGARAGPSAGASGEVLVSKEGEPVNVRRGGLGRGLGALIPTAPKVESDPSLPDGPVVPSDPPPDGHDSPPADSGAVDSDRGVAPRTAAEGLSAHFDELPIGAITPNPRQPRQVFDEDALAELVLSIREVGLLQPIVVRPVGEATYELVMGERRWRASQAAGLTTIPAIVRDTGDDAMLRDALLENLHRSQLNPLEEAAAYDQLLADFSCTHEELAQTDRPLAAADLQHPAAAQAARTGAAPGGRRRAVGGSRARPAGARRPAGAGAASPTGSSRRACRSVPSRRSWRSAGRTRPRSRVARSAGRRRPGWSTCRSGCRTGSRPGCGSRWARPGARS